jgi:preprotein translocase subunit YajC
MEVALVYFALLALAFFFLIVRPQRRRVTAHRAFVSTLQLGDDVVTNGGIYGTVRALRGDAVELEIAPGVVVTVARAAVAQRAYPQSSDAIGGGDAIEGGPIGGGDSAGPHEPDGPAADDNGAN